MNDYIVEVITYVIITRKVVFLSGGIVEKKAFPPPYVCVKHVI